MDLDPPPQGDGLFGRQVYGESGEQMVWVKAVVKQGTGKYLHHYGSVCPPVD